MARPARRPGNLPAEATSFIGRRRELADIRKRLATARLVSLIGPGGVGKTRLALRAAADLARGFPAGAWLVEFADIRDAGLVDHAVLAALDLRDQATTDPSALLLSYLRDKRLLLVVDNCEHVLSAATRTLAGIMRAAPGVCLIATSREPLSIPGEHVLPVPPLNFTSPRNNEAVTLFAERAAAGTGTFELTDRNAAAVVEVCRRLDGLPLAIELAAVRTRVLTAHQIRDRLSDRFGLLASTAALPRHQTLRTAIDWSHDLLNADEQTLLRRLSVFAGRFTLDDVATVCLPSPLDLLSSLVNKSLVVKEDAGEVAVYRLHETMREYAALKMRGAGEQEQIELRCADYFIDAFGRMSDGARYRLTEWLEWTELEIDNVRGVLQWCVARGDRTRGLAMTAAVGWYWVTRATSEGVRWLDTFGASAALMGARKALAPAVVCFMRGFLALLQSDAATALPSLERAARLAGEGGEPSLRVESLSLSAICRHMVGDRATAVRRLRSARALAETLDDFAASIAVLQAQALTALFDRDLAAVRATATEGVRRSRAVGDKYALEMMLLNLGVTALVLGDLADARASLTESLGIARQIDDRPAQYLLLDALGCHAEGTSQPRLAAVLLGAAEAVQSGIGTTMFPYLMEPVMRAKAALVATLGPTVFETEYGVGRHLGREAAIELALGEPASARSSGREQSPLGKRDAEVASLVAAGLSNKRIAARLLISEHTVDSHIRNIMNKLGVGSRAQIAAWIVSSAAEPPSG